MAFFKSLKKNRFNTRSDTENKDFGILIFENTSEVIQAEKVLKSAEWDIRVVGPPPEDAASSIATRRSTRTSIGSALEV